ncbi:hypothetical protein [Acinetobacter pittii]|uniref:hypothetical protein n=1 Tax=Acinetobacter pittii TaxID=48296 RepID=UPI00388DE263
MNVKATPYKYYLVIGVSAVMATVTLSNCGFQTAESSTNTNNVFVPNTTPSVYSVKTAQITGKDSGIASVNLDGFTLDFDFKYSVHKDDYGVPGSDFIAVDITELGEISVKDANGNPYKDFTDYIDHRNINALLIGFIEKNRLVEE